MEELTQERKTGELYTIGKLIQDSISVIKRDFRVLLEIALLAAVFILIFVLLFEGVKWKSSLILYAIFLLIAAVSLIFAIAQIYAINSLSEDKPVTVGESIEAALEKYFPFLGVSILLVLVVFGGFAILIVPGIIFATWFTFPYYIVILENKNGLAALKRSRQLVKGNWWYVFAVSCVLIAISKALAFALTGILWAILYPIAKTSLVSTGILWSTSTAKAHFNFQVFFVFLAFSLAPATVAAIPFYTSNLLLFKKLREVKDRPGKNKAV